MGLCGQPVFLAGHLSVTSIHSPAYRALVDALVAERKAAGLTQQALADKLRRPQSFVAKTENRERRLDVVEFLEFTTALGCDPCNILHAIQAQLPRSGSGKPQTR